MYRSKGSISAPAVRVCIVVVAFVLAVGVVGSCRAGKPVSSASFPGSESAPDKPSGDSESYIVNDSFGLALLDRYDKALSHPDRVVSLDKLDKEDSALLTITSKAGRLPDDLFMAVNYDSSQWSFKGASYGGAMGDNAIHIECIASSGVLNLGVARMKDERGVKNGDGAEADRVIYTLLFAKGAESAMRAVCSAPVEEHNKVVDLSGEDLGNNTVRLTWTEINIGDYDNSGEVGVPDITPIAVHFLETPATADNPELFILIDGDNSDEIGISDITPIANNYLNLISGYLVFRDDLGDEPIAPGSELQPTIARPEPSPDHGRLLCTFSDRPTASGTYTYTVRPFSLPDDEVPVGIESDPAAVEFTVHGIDDVTPPVWDDDSVKLSVTGGESSVFVEWGRAVDAESSPVDYLIYVSEGDSVEYETPHRTIGAGDPDPDEHSLAISDLPSGTRFTIAVRARDNALNPNIDQNTETVTVDLVKNLGWLDFRGGPGRTGSILSTLYPPLTLSFEFSKDPPGTWFVSTPSIVGSDLASPDIAVCAIDEVVFALDISDPDNIQEIWTYPTGDLIDGSPTVAADRVFVGSRDHNFYCLDLADGAFIWSFPITGNCATSPAVVDDVVFFGTTSGDLYGLSIFDGEAVHAHSVDATMSSSPAVVDGYVYGGSGNSPSVPAKIICYDTVLKTRKWEYPTDAGVFGTPAVADDLVMVGDLAGNLYILSTSGAELYKIPLGAGINASPAYGDGIVYAATLDSKVYAINTATGEEIWPAPATIPGAAGIFSSPLLTGNYLYVAGSNGHLYALEAATGEIVWEWGGSSIPVTSSPVTWGGQIFLQGGDNTLRAFISNSDYIPPAWTSHIGIYSASWTGEIGNPFLRLIAGDATESKTPPVKWMFYMSRADEVDFIDADLPSSQTITLGPVLAPDYTLNPAGMAIARAQWNAHRAWYAARVLDSAIPANYDSNEVVIDYTFPWYGFERGIDTDDGETIYQFDAAYDSDRDSFLIAAYNYIEDGAIWKLNQYEIGTAVSQEFELMPLTEKASAGYVDLAKAPGESGAFFMATAVPISGDPVRRELHVGSTANAGSDFSFEKIDPSDHNWGEVAIAIDDRGLPAVANTYMEDITSELLFATFWPQYHYLDDNDPQAWHREFIDLSGVQTWYIDLEFKTDGTPVVAYSKSNKTTGGNTGLFVAERRGADDWAITEVEGGDLAGITGKHLSMALDENDRPVIVFSDLVSELVNLALPTGDGTWDIVELGSINSQGRTIHHGTDILRNVTDGQEGYTYALAHFSQVGTSDTLQNVFVRGFRKVDGSWFVPDNNDYWIGEVEQPMSDSGNIVLVEHDDAALPNGAVLFALCLDEWGQTLLINSVESENFLR